MKRQPSQRRSQATVAVIMEGAAQVLERGGSFTTNFIADRAGVSIGTLYQYFDTKESVIAQLSRTTRCDMLCSVAAAIDRCAALGLTQALPRVLAAAVEAKRRRPRLARALDALEAELPLAEDAACIVAGLQHHLVRWLGPHLPHASLGELASLALDVHAVVDTLAHAALTRHGDLDNRFIARATACVSGLVAASRVQ